MTPAIPGRYSWLDFNAPLSPARADGLVARLARASQSTVLDLGCGWGELLLRLLTALPAASGTGIDSDADHIARARRNAAARGLADRAVFVQGRVSESAPGPADLALSIGASHVFGDASPSEQTDVALRGLRDLVGTGGRVLFGECFWQRPPTPADLAALWPGTRADEFTGLTGLVGRTAAAGFRPLWIETAGADEWEFFESGFLAGREEWLASHRDHPEAAAVRAEVDAHRAVALGCRGLLGFAFLTLTAH